ncbi:MAG: HAMP domain-containing protein [Gemmatimonadaceae bacterium]|nr:HAMP domain-containing protein [Gemmatimonadaceae bacterium]
MTTRTVLEPLRPRIRVRLTVLYATTLLVVLGAAAVALRYAVHEALRREHNDSLRASAALVSQFFRVELAEYLTIDATLTHIAGELVFEDRAIHVHRPNGQEFVVVGAPRTRAPRPPVAPIRTLNVPLEPALAPGWMVVVEGSSASVDAVQARIDRGIALGVPLLVVLAAASGWWLTGRTLRPVGSMADAAARIVPGSQGRIPINDARDELGRLGAQFNALLDRLDGALTQQRQFLADAAHELRTPLARLRGRVELALLPSETRSADPSELTAIHEELLRMSRLVDELMQLARADADVANEQVLHQFCFLDDLVTDELHRWHGDAERAGVTIRCSALQEAPIHGDDTQLRRLLGILLDNAIRYSHAGGTVDVRVLREGGLVTLHVEDNGIGIAVHERTRVAERFFRGARARAHRNDGSGLGLAIAQWIVKRHDGALHVGAGHDGQGTLVRVELPARAPATVS